MQPGGLDWGPGLGAHPKCQAWLGGLAWPWDLAWHGVWPGLESGLAWGSSQAWGSFPFRGSGPARGSNRWSQPMEPSLGACLEGLASLMGLPEGATCLGGRGWPALGRVSLGNGSP